MNIKSMSQTAKMLERCESVASSFEAFFTYALVVKIASNAKRKANIKNKEINNSTMHLIYDIVA